MTYEYRCDQCKVAFDVIKSAKEMDAPENCAQCGTISTRQFVPSRVYFNNTKVHHPEYNPGLGAIVRDPNHRKELAKIKGVEEVGNESIESLHKHHDKKREDNRESAWADADKGWVGNGDIGA